MCEVIYIENYTYSMKIIFIKDYVDSFNNLIFKIGDITDCKYSKYDINCYYVPLEIEGIDFYMFNYEDLNVLFVTLSEYRNQKINEILE